MLDSPHRRYNPLTREWALVAVEEGMINLTLGEGKCKIRAEAVQDIETSPRDVIEFISSDLSQKEASMA